MPGIDLHTHSNHSDGTFTPRELIALAAERGLATVALSDHDTTDGLAEATAAGAELHVEVVPAVEFSTVRDREGIHILCYEMDPSHPEFAAELRRLQEDRFTRGERMVAKLQELGLPAVRWRGATPLNEDSYVIEGQFLTVGSNGVPDQKIIGFALGGGELRVLAQAYRVDGKQRKLLGEADVGSETAAPGLATTLPVAKLSATRAAQSVATGAGVVRSLTSKVKKGAEDTAAAIIEQLKPKMQEQGWF